VKGLVMATMLEAKPLVEALSLEPVPGGPCRVYRGGDILLAISGIGKVNAGVALAYLAVKYGIGVAVNLGAAGATSGRLELGNIRHVNRVIEYDRPHVIGREMRIVQPDMLPGFEEASLATQDIPVIEPGLRGAMAACADLVDMEGAAVLQSSRMFGLPCYLFKIVSDTPAHVADRDIVENIRVLRKELCGFFLERVLQSLPDGGKQVPVHHP
jgi:adenosylhomocysteine nucleosidase